MSAGAPRFDLVVLSADLDIESAIQGLISRPEALGIRPVQAQFYRHPGRDPGCRTQAHEYLRSFANAFHHALVVFDFEGSGGGAGDRTELEADLESRLKLNGWGERAAVIVIFPEVEAWVWSDSPQVDKVCGWTGNSPGLRQWLLDKTFLGKGQSKPSQPKQAFRSALRAVRKQPSAALFKELAQSVSLKRCVDPAFGKLKTTLQKWFAPANP